MLQKIFLIPETDGRLVLPRWTKFFYMNAVPTHRELNWPRLDPTPDDFSRSMKKQGRTVFADDTKRGKVFDVSATFKLPRELQFTPNNLLQSDRSAGTAANHRAAAATAWILSNSSSNFVNAPTAWTGTVIWERTINPLKLNNYLFIYNNGMLLFGKYSIIHFFFEITLRLTDLVSK